MSRISMALMGLAVAAFLAFTVAPSGVAQQREGTFEGDFVSIVRKSNPSSSTDLEKVQIRKVDGRAFVVGVGADVPDNWQKGRTVWVALDDVSELTVFSTLEDLRKAGIPAER